MFKFLFGFLLGGATGAAIVLAMAPSYQYREDGEEEDDVRAKVNELTELVRATVKEAVEEGKVTLREAVEEGKVAAEEKAEELRGMVKKYQNGQEEEEKA